MLIRSVDSSCHEVVPGYGFGTTQQGLWFRSHGQDIGIHFSAVETTNMDDLLDFQSFLIGDQPGMFVP